MIERKTFNQNLLINVWTKKPENKTRFNIWFVDFVTKNKIEYKDVVSFFYNKECPKGYDSIDKLDLFIGDDFMSACKSTSLDLLKKNISNSDRIHFYKKSTCPRKFIFIAGTDKIQFCLIK